MRKFLVYIFILVALIGILNPTEKVQAQAAGEYCVTSSGEGMIATGVTKTDCENTSGWEWVPAEPGASIGYCTTKNGLQVFSDVPKTPCDKIGGVWKAGSKPPDIQAGGVSGNSPFEQEVGKQICILAHWVKGTVQGCVLNLAYWTLYVLGGWLLAIAATFFNFLIKISLDGALLQSDFVSSAWGTVRDLSNIFFILVLLYIGIKIILGMGGHGVKQMIAHVVIMALLINFSMFMTKIVIDTSNILALIFYNKIKAEGKNNPGGPDGLIDQSTGTKDLSGGLTQSFNPAYHLDANFFATAGNISTPASAAQPGQPSTAILIGITVIAAAIMIFAAYALFVAGFSFLGRLIELFVLIIFSPFAFMSYSTHELEKLGYIGWTAWLHRLLSVSFMAPIFMFMLYFIFLLLGAEMFKFTDAIATRGVLGKLLSLIIPALIVLTLLLKATSFAKKGAGTFGDVAMGVGKAAAVLGLGVATGGAAMALRGTVGATAQYVQNDAARMKDFRTFGGWRNWSTGKKLNPFAYAGQLRKTVTAGAAQGIHAIGLGAKLKTADEAMGHKSHAKHILDAKMQAEFGHQYGKDGKYKDLTEHEQGIVKGEIEKDEMAKFRYGKLFKDLEAVQARLIQDLYRQNYRAIDDGHGKTVGIGLTPGAVQGGAKFKSDYFVDTAKASAALGEFAQALRKGSYDVRNITEASIKSKQGINKGAVIAAVGTALLIKTALLKKGAGIDVGTGKKDFFEDLKNTLTGALSNVNIKVGGGGGGHGGGDDHAKEVKSVGH